MEIERNEREIAREGGGGKEPWVIDIKRPRTRLRCIAIDAKPRRDGSFLL